EGVPASMGGFAHAREIQSTRGARTLDSVRVVETSLESGGRPPHEEPASSRLELLERDAELATIDGLIGRVSGIGMLLAIEGPAGMGKPWLIHGTRWRAKTAGARVLAARGSELESTFSFGVVRQLFEPFLIQLPEEERAEVLAGAAELATPILEPAHIAAEPAAQASLAVLHGLYWLTANIAAHRPLLLAVDDLHWCDAASLRWLAYLLPRLEGLEIFIVVGVRPSEPGEDPAVVAQIISDPLAVVIRPSPLTPAGVAEFIRGATGSTPDDAFADACQTITAGHPLLLLQLERSSAAERLASTAANVSRLPDLAAQAGSRAVAVRLSRLPSEATRVAQAVAIFGKEVDVRFAAALAGLDERQAAEAVSDLARVDILRPQPP